MDRFVDNMDLIVLPNVSKIWTDGFDIDYKHNAGKMMAIDWQLHENFVDIAWFEGIHATPADDPKIAPIGTFAVLAIGRKFYERIGYLDIDMDIWGGEDYELIFRTWLCGGRVEYLPCSHVAHMYRQHRYSEKSKGKGGYRWNMDRLVELWMDDYKKFYYQGIEKHEVVYGDLTERLQLKERLKCKPFKWYIDNVFPRLNEIPKKR
jgi:polypeptide N-acetylgalactosaminyltransferase